MGKTLTSNSIDVVQNYPIGSCRNKERKKKKKKGGVPFKEGIPYSYI